MTIVDAWMLTATEIQSEGYDEVDAAAMGPAVPEVVLAGPGGGQPKLVWVTDYEDYFWNKGPTGPDLPDPPDFWVLTVPID
jgi:hypothetical protein